MTKLTFHSIQANKGDSFVIQWGDKNALLIDGGTQNIYGKISSRIKNLNLRSVFITHVDQDHIGGIIHLIRKSSINISDTDFYMNHPLLCAHYNGEKVRYLDGDTLKKLLEDKGKKFLSSHTTENNKITICGLQINILSPTLELVSELNENWTASQVISDGKLTYLLKQKNNGDIINGSSIAQLLTYKDTKILLLADSHPEVIINSLRTLGFSKKNPLTVNLIKLAHHGSKHNTNQELLEIVKSQKYYISTNGAGNSYHPHKEILDLISNITEYHNFTMSELYLNYDIEHKIRKKHSNFPENLNLIHRQTLDFI
jgi:beta-lactamase superfamily II metal-dependent hydrolase